MPAVAVQVPRIEGGDAAVHARVKGTGMPQSRFGKTLKEDERRDLGKMLGALEPFRNLRQTMPLQYVVSFLLVALNEGRGVAEYAREAGVSQSVMSRHLLDIGERNRHMEEGFGLITFRPNPMELRKHEIYLTDHGRRIAQQILRTIRGPGEQQDQNVHSA